MNTLTRKPQVPVAVKRSKLLRYNRIVSAGYEVRIAEKQLKTTTRTLSRWAEELGIPMFKSTIP